MSQINHSLESDNNIHLSSRENFSIIMDYSHENSTILKNTKNFFYNNKSIDKEQENKNIKLSIDNNYNKRIKKEEKQNKSSRSGSNSNIKKERKIISAIGANSDKKAKNVKFNELPPLNRTKKEEKKGVINNDYLFDNDKSDLNISLKKKVDELNSELSKLKYEPNLKNINNLETNYKLMSKELEELKHDNSYIKNKLEEISQKQNQSNKINKSINSSISNNKSSIRNIKHNQKNHWKI